MCEHVFVMDELATSDQIATAIDGLWAIRDGTSVPLLEKIYEYEVRELYKEDGARSIEDWIAFRRGCSPATAREHATLARALASLPLLKEALRSGRLSWDRAVLICGVASPDDESYWVGEAERDSYAYLEFLVKAAHRYTREQLAGMHRERSLTSHHDGFGFLRINARLSDADGAVVLKALERIREHMGPDNPDGTYNPERMRDADALVDLASTRIAADDEPDLATVVVHVDITELNKIKGTAVLEDGGILGAEIARRMACDSRIQPVISQLNGEILAIGTTVHTIPRRIRRLLKNRDKGCRFADCGRTRGLQAHHIIHFAHGGPTTMDNLVMLCPYHHRLIHEGGWRILLDSELRMRFVRPDGLPLHHRPVPLRQDVRERIFGPPPPKRGPGRQLAPART